MNRWSLITALSFIIFLFIGCGKGGNSPVVPLAENDIANLEAQTGPVTTVLGYYDVYFDPETGRFDIADDRTAAFTLNIVPLLNKMNIPKNGITFDNIVIHNDDPTILGVDVKFTVYHPFPGYDQFDAYDMRGVVIGNGSQTLEYGNLQVGKQGTDLWMKNADGYTRWFNPTEFTTENIFGYMPGGWQNSEGNAQLNPYKYYAKDLQNDDDLWNFLTGPYNWDGVFESGNGRVMELEFPMPPVGKGLYFGYAVVVAWEDQGLTGPFHPYHVAEPVAISANVTPDIWFDGTNTGGDLIVDFDLFAWENQPDTIKIESSVLDQVETFDAASIGTPVSDNVTSYSISSPASELTTSQGHYLWVIAEDTSENYSNGMTGMPHADGPLAAFWRFDVPVSDTAENTSPEINGITDDVDPVGLNLELNDSFSLVTYIVDYTDPDVGQTHMIEWFIEDSTATGPTDPPDAMPFDWSDKPYGDYQIWVTVDDGFGPVTGGPYLVSRTGWARTWGAGNQDRGYGLVVDHEGSVYVTGSYYSNCDFDPGPGTDFHNSNGNRDTFISKFDSSGNFQWVRTWDDSASFGGGAQDITCDSDNNIYVSGYFFGNNVDFDPGPGVDLHSYHGGGGDPYVTVFNSNGDFIWARTWGSDEASFASVALGVSVDSAHNVYVAGNWWGTGDFDPGPGELILSSNTEQWDAFITKFNSTGEHQWAYLIGGTLLDMAYGCHVDANDDVYVTGYYCETVDFDPGPDEVLHNDATEGDNFLWKLDGDGNHLWSRAFGNGYPFRMANDSANNIYVCGNFEGTAQFDPDGGTTLITPDGARDTFINVFAENGDWLYVKTWDSIATGDSTGGYVGIGMWIDGSDNIYTAAHFTGTADVDPGPDVVEKVSNGDRDCLVTKFDPSGDFLWGNAFGGTSIDDCTMVSVDDITGNIYATGWFFNSVDFDPGDYEDFHSVIGSLDVFLVRYKQDGYL
ncbi:MAG: hypothetical protein NTY09_15360 [bacterium]|nr:hypothetical protein [bacterium]